jgi:hypothetical protein
LAENTCLNTPPANPLAISGTGMGAARIRVGSTFLEQIFINVSIAIVVHTVACL